MVVETLLICLYPMMEMITDYRSLTLDETINAAMAAIPILIGIATSLVLFFSGYNIILPLKSEGEKIFVILALSTYACVLLSLMIRNPFKGSKDDVTAKKTAYTALFFMSFAFFIVLLAAYATL